MTVHRLDHASESLSRRRLLQLGAVSAVALPGCQGARHAASAPHEDVSEEPRTYNGSTDPFPIPWLDKNGSHNQPAGPNLEPSHIYHFKGAVARCAGFTGAGTDNRGERVLFGTRTTDCGFMAGEYLAARQPQQGTFAHL